METKKILTFTGSDYGMEAEELIDLLRKEKLTLRVLIEDGVLVGDNYEEEETEWCKKTTFKQGDLDVEFSFNSKQTKISEYFDYVYTSRDPFKISENLEFALYDHHNKPSFIEMSELIENSKFGENISNIFELEQYLNELVSYYFEYWSEPLIEDRELLISLQQNSPLDLLLNEKELKLVSDSDDDYTVILPDLKKNFENWNSGDLIRVKNLFERSMSAYYQIRVALLKRLDEFGEEEMEGESTYIMDFYYGNEYGNIGWSKYAFGLAIKSALEETKDKDKLSVKTESFYGYICRFVKCNRNCDEMNEIMREHKLPFHFLQ